VPGRSSVGVGELQVSEFLAALGARTPAPASGAAAALTGAFAAALVELAARFAEDDAAVARAKALSRRLTQLADEDAATYEAFLATGSEEARRRTIDVPREIAVNADEVERLAEQVGARLTSSVAGDAEAAQELARAAARVARRLAELNASNG
jgi:formiminotetrahydrofolate cyclodeaminase